MAGRGRWETGVVDWSRERRRAEGISKSERSLSSCSRNVGFPMHRNTLVFRPRHSMTHSTWIWFWLFFFRWYGFPQIPPAGTDWLETPGCVNGVCVCLINGCDMTRAYSHSSLSVWVLLDVARAPLARQIRNKQELFSSALHLNAYNSSTSISCLDKEYFVLNIIHGVCGFSIIQSIVNYSKVGSLSARKILTSSCTQRSNSG